MNESRNKPDRAAEDYLVSRAAALGISQATVHQYIMHYGLLAVSEQINNLACAIKVGAAKNKSISNPAGWLRSALDVGYTDKVGRLTDRLYI
jgi:hypothetical protein